VSDQKLIEKLLAQARVVAPGQVMLIGWSGVRGSRFKVGVRGKDGASFTTPTMTAREIRHWLMGFRVGNEVQR